MNELKVVRSDSDIEQFEKDVNGWCCNCGYSIISCTANIMTDARGNYCGTIYIAFLGKSTKED